MAASRAPDRRHTEATFQASTCISSAQHLRQTAQETCLPLQALEPIPTADRFASIRTEAKPISSSPPRTPASAIRCCGKKSNIASSINWAAAPTQTRHQIPEHPPNLRSAAALIDTNRQKKAASSTATSRISSASRHRSQHRSKWRLLCFELQHSFLSARPAGETPFTGQYR